MGGLCLEVSLGTWEPVLLILFFSDRTNMTYLFCAGKKDTEPTSQAKPRDTDHLQPSNLAARTRYAGEHTSSKCGRDPRPATRGGSQVLCV